MDDDQTITNLEQLIEQLDSTTRDRERVDMHLILAAVGSRSFGSLILIAGLITLAPLIGDIPGMPTLMGLLVLLLSCQLLLRRRRLWLPRWLLERSISQARFAKAMKFMRKPAHHIDKLLKPRLTYLTQGPGLYTIALICSAVALMMPPMEFIPFSANFAGAALTLFGLALIARDGLLALLGFGLTGLAVGFIGYQTLL
ncbi:exopolysaccharide biosynthesis protein [Pistricoccus aurantiacus]|uniref:Exopolysaccharide biosynthesis protein n=1 Tax=Pistricoccus aurantiacus TaxID=1883414 RepID=A0A5B8SSZ3_9GAMM|nr:exopolysaccharide biosynthesis protein [Pistricoccus aurantiacus]QEA38213.1 exopolysaccharide biosynthesis protein [Pistricoccus aurantiacus]